MFIKSNIGADDRYYIAGHVFHIISCLNQVLFTCNNAYCINEKKAVRLVESFEHKPGNYAQKVNCHDYTGGIKEFVEVGKMNFHMYNQLGSITVMHYLNRKEKQQFIF